MTGVLENKVIVVTGAGRGIGEAAARLFAESGAKLVLANRSDEGQALTDELSGAGHEALFVRTDVSQEADVAAMVEAAVSRFGRIDGAFNNAGVNTAGKLIHELDLADWQKAIDVDLTGTFLCMKHQIGAMLKTGGGSIVISGSIASAVSLPKSAEYNAAKHGVLGLMRNAATDYAKQGVRVNTLLIGATLTPMFEEQQPGVKDDQDAIDALSPLGRLAQPREMGEAAQWLLSDASAFVTGTTLTVDGGYTAK